MRTEDGEPNNTGVAVPKIRPMGVMKRNSGARLARITDTGMFEIDEIGRDRKVSELNKTNGIRSQLLTVRQVSEWLNVSPSWVRDHATNRRRPRCRA